MAQWIPKTAWRLQNLNSLYGTANIGLHIDGVTRAKLPYKAGPSQAVPLTVAVPFSQHTRGSGEASSSEGQQYLATAHRRGVPFLDLRDRFAAETSPVAGATPVHVHDLLSGACNTILPKDRDAEIVLVSDNHQRGLNAIRALQRWGFDRIILTNATGASVCSSP
jgi:hypothetical protein